MLRMIREWIGEQREKDRQFWSRAFTNWIAYTPRGKTQPPKKACTCNCPEGRCSHQWLHDRCHCGETKKNHDMLVTLRR